MFICAGPGIVSPFSLITTSYSNLTPCLSVLDINGKRKLGQKKDLERGRGKGQKSKQQVWVVGRSKRMELRLPLPPQPLSCHSPHRTIPVRLEEAGKTTKPNQTKQSLNK